MVNQSYLRLVECALRDGSSPFIYAGVIVFSLLGWLLGYYLGRDAVARRQLEMLFIMVGGVLGLILGAMIAALFHEGCGPSRW